MFNIDYFLLKCTAAYLQRCTYVTLATESFEQIVRLELILLVGHHSGHLER